MVPVVSPLSEFLPRVPHGTRQKRQRFCALRAAGSSGNPEAEGTWALQERRGGPRRNPKMPPEKHGLSALTSQLTLLATGHWLPQASPWTLPPRPRSHQLPLPPQLGHGPQINPSGDDRSSTDLRAQVTPEHHFRAHSLLGQKWGQNRDSPKLTHSCPGLGSPEARSQDRPRHVTTTVRIKLSSAYSSLRSTAFKNCFFSPLKVQCSFWRKKC